MDPDTDTYPGMTLL